GMTRDDALLAFERHATSKISRAEDLSAIATLGFRGEALASIASVARVELVTGTEMDAAATRVVIEGGKMRDVKDAAHPRGTTITVRDLFFNVPARRKFLRSEATESFHLTNLVTHYALAHPEIAFTLTNNGRETLRAAPAKDTRERAYQIFGAQFLENLLEVNAGLPQVARVRGFVSAPRERRTSRDAQYLFINGRYVRDRLISRALSEAYRSVLPHGVYPAALLFLEIPLEEVDVNVHPAKTEVRFRRAAAVADAVREAVRAALATSGYLRTKGASEEVEREAVEHLRPELSDSWTQLRPSDLSSSEQRFSSTTSEGAPVDGEHQGFTSELVPPLRQDRIEFGFAPGDEELIEARSTLNENPEMVRGVNEILRHVHAASFETETEREGQVVPFEQRAKLHAAAEQERESLPAQSSSPGRFPPLVSAAQFVREVPVESVSTNIRALGQLEESYIIAIDDDGLLLIDQHAAHERILFDKYHALERERSPESQNLLMPETIDLTPAQAAAFDAVTEDLEHYGFGLMRLSGRTVAIKAVPADLAVDEARNLLAEILETADAEKRGRARATLREEIAASLACRAAIKVNTPLAPEKMRWLIDRLLLTSSPTTCPHGRPGVLRLTTRDLEKGFHRA
ncbi:MAG TPA: DNA mismatch repair endonuclease MutL, partial [Pyrinomonadaceae bacterium]|nr:DNA mismatch repair endonuclease MutL [Pyrinomonadaceae bacterium]